MPERRPHVWRRPTGDVEDDFAWMRQLEDPALGEYLTAENDHTAAWFAPLDDLVDELYGEIKSRVQETDESTPVFNGGWWYVTSTVEGGSYPRHHRGPQRDRASEQLLLDENTEAAGHEYFELGAFDASHDHTTIAWSVDTTGDEHYTLRIRAFDRDGSFRELDDEISDTANAGVAWSADGTWLFYVRPDEQQRPFQVWRHRVGDTTSERDEIVFEEPDERFYVEIGETRSDRWVVIDATSKTSSEVRVIPSASPLAEPIVVAPRREGVEYHVDDWGDRFLILTNEESDDFRVIVSADGDPTSGDWSDLVPHEPGRRIVGMEPFSGHLVVSEWSAAQPRLRILFRDGDERIVDLGDEPHDVAMSVNPEWTSTTLRFGTQSMSTPPTLYDEDVSSGERTLLRRLPTPNIVLDDYTSSRRWTESSGGVRVPIDIVHHVDTPLDGTAPTVLYGYGAYEASFPPWFSVARLSFLDRGGVFALAHPRGGGELGRGWYLDGKLLAKQNTFDDTLACARHLVETGVTAPGRLCLRGGSAGGLLVGACVTQQPDLFVSAVAEVPFVDVVNSMSDPSLPLTVTEWDEWGDPREEPFASAIAGYSPYDNTDPADYPAIYVTAGLVDPRVSVHEPAKWVARLRRVNTSDRPIVLRTEMGAGHGGPTGRYDAWRDESRTLAFILSTT
jgi:oligopeptidase B